MCLNKTEASENNKEKKTKATDSCDSGKKEPIKKSEENKKEDEAVTNNNAPGKVNGEGDSKIVNGEKDRESSPSEDGDEKKRDAEVVFIQDLGFTVKIVSPGAEPLDIQVLYSTFTLQNFNLHFHELFSVYGWVDL